MAKKNNNVLLLNLESAELKCFYYRNSAFFSELKTWKRILMCINGQAELVGDKMWQHRLFALIKNLSLERLGYDF